MTLRPLVRCPRSPRRRGPAQAGDALVASDVSADLLLTLATLDPAIGGDHLGTWGTNAVVVVSAGQSSAERVHGVGEMIRLAGMRLDSVVLIGADKNDESIGLMRRTDEQAGIGVLRPVKLFARLAAGVRRPGGVSSWRSAWLPRVCWCGPRRECQPG